MASIRMGERMTNLLQETVAALHENGKTTQNVLQVQLRDKACSWNSFAEMASVFNYNASYGIAYVNLDLIVIGKGWWLERGEYDGSEWWIFRTTPSLLASGTPLTSLEES